MYPISHSLSVFANINKFPRLIQALGKTVWFANATCYGRSRLLSVHLLEVGNVLGKLSEAAAYRGAQTDSVGAFIDRNAAHSIICCGDLNETPVSYTYQQLDRRLTSAYRQAGFGPGFTFSRRSFPVRIDHLFFSDDWTCTSCTIDRTVSSSDHYPIIVHLSKKQR